MAVAAAAAFLCPLCAWGASVSTVEGLPPWLVPRAQRAAQAVWTELSQRNVPPVSALDALAVVAQRLFSGYDVTISLEEKGPLLSFHPTLSLPWVVTVTPPELQSPLTRWIQEDGQMLAQKLSHLLKGVPYRALSWGDEAFRSSLHTLMEDCLPGWRGTSVVRIDEGQVILDIALLPSPPFVLATDPRITSSTLPNVLRDRLRESFLKDLSPLVGLPVAWIDRHREQVNRWARGMAQERSTVSAVNARVDVELRPDQIAQVDASVESRRYSLRAWVAVQAGAQDRVPEFGLHFGRFAQIFSGVEPEFYGEFICELDDWDIESRLGFRWSPCSPVWIGAEYAWGDRSSLWYRLWLTGHRKGPYLWWRHSQDRENQGSLGYRINETVSLELQYDDRFDDRWSLRAVGDL
ncbi:MAG: hypothetical protein CSA35_02995 [Dethiosulfovibrio peptidovorans]|nr:MAG: hypothetical protein CSA35_02995 [Dethiosulfovibrio peptidovorans]